MSWVEKPETVGGYLVVSQRRYRAVVLVAKSVTLGQIAHALSSFGWSDIRLLEQGATLPSDWPDRRRGVAGACRIVYVEAYRSGATALYPAWWPHDSCAPSVIVLSSFFEVGRPMDSMEAVGSLSASAPSPWKPLFAAILALSVARSVGGKRA